MSNKKTIKLDEFEINEFRSIHEESAKLETEYLRLCLEQRTLEIRLSEIKGSLDVMYKRLAEAQNEGQIFNQKIQNKYGNGILNIDTFEYEIDG